MTKQWRILPLGDSLTLGVGEPSKHSYGGYRTRLWHRLTEAGVSFDFVGSARAGPPALPDKDHEGHPGWRIDQIDAIASECLARFRPDIILLIAGSNDIYQQWDLPEAPKRLNALVNRLQKEAPHAHLLLGSLPLMAGPLAHLMPDVEAYNAALLSLFKDGERLSVVPLHTLLEADDLYDGVHPKDIGYAKMADAWFEKLAPLNQRSF